MTDPSDYPWNVRISIGGVSFIAPGMESEQEAEAIKSIVESSSDAVDNAEVFRQ